MVFVRVCPFPLRRGLALAFALLAASVVSCFADPLLFPVKATPYDNQMARIRRAKIPRHDSRYFLSGIVVILEGPRSRSSIVRALLRSLFRLCVVVACRP